MPPELSLKDIQSYFERFGPIDIAYVTPNYSRRKPNTLIAFVNFKLKESVKAALSQPDHTIKGFMINC